MPGDCEYRSVKQAGAGQLGGKAGDAEASVHQHLRRGPADQPSVGPDVGVDVRFGDAEDPVADFSDVEPARRHWQPSCRTVGVHRVHAGRSAGRPLRRQPVPPNAVSTRIAQRQSLLVAMRAPSASAANLAQPTFGSISRLPACEANPQSLPIMTFSRPTSSAYRTVISAMSSGCSTQFAPLLSMPGMMILPSGSFTSSKA